MNYPMNNPMNNPMETNKWRRMNFRMAPEDHKYLRSLCYEHGGFQQLFGVLFGWLVNECRRQNVRVGQTQRLDKILQERFPEMFAKREANHE